MVHKALRGVLMLLVLALAGCDHATKLVAKASLCGDKPLVLISGVLDLQYTENRDAAFNLLSAVPLASKEWLLLLASGMTLGAIALAWWKRRGQAGRTENVAYVLVVGGAIGNVADRVTRGYVVDFIHLHRWPVFNVADIAICAGATLLGVAMVRRHKAMSGMRAMSARDPYRSTH
jgi:signal peptidase II